MNPSFRFDADGDRSLQVLWENGERVFRRGWRPGGDGIRSAVPSVLSATEHPTLTASIAFTIERATASPVAART
jgi:hypothetical protein